MTARRATCRERLLEAAELALAADQRRVEAPRAALGAGVGRPRGGRPHRLRLALGADRLDGLDVDGVADQRVRRPGRGGSRPGGAACSSRAAVLTVSPVTRVWPLRRVAGHHLAGVDPGPEADARSRARPSSSAFSAARAAPDLGGRADRAQGVVLVDDRDAEHRHDRVADELLDRPAVASMIRRIVAK